jgi:hypothetical protein
MKEDRYINKKTMSTASMELAVFDDNQNSATYRKNQHYITDTLNKLGCTETAGISRD